jgi:hypothetical protein
VPNQIYGWFAPASGLIFEPHAPGLMDESRSTLGKEASPRRHCFRALPISLNHCLVYFIRNSLVQDTVSEQQFSGEENGFDIHLNEQVLGRRKKSKKVNGQPDTFEFAIGQEKVLGAGHLSLGE